MSPRRSVVGGQAPRFADRLGLVRVGLAIVVGLCGLTALVVGLHDLMAATLVFQVYGLMLAALGLVALLGSTAALRESWRDLLVPGAVATILITLSLLASAARGADWQDLIASMGHIVPWGVAVAGSVLLLLLARLIATGNTLAAAWRRISLVAVAPLAVSIFQFWYTNELQPSTVAPSLGISLTAVRGDEQGGLTPITAKLTIRNSSSTKGIILGSVYRITAAHIESRSGVESTKASQSASLNVEDPIKNAYKYREGVLPTLQWGAIVPPRNYLDAGEEYSKEIVTYVPAGAGFNLIRFTARIAVARANAVQLDAATDFEEPCAGTSPERGLRLVGWHQIVEPSWVRRLTTPAQSLAIVWLLQRGSNPNTWYTEYPVMRIGLASQSHRDCLGVRFDPDSAERPQQLEALASYGIVVTTASQELPLAAQSG